MLSNCLLHFNKSRIAFENNYIISHQKIQGITSLLELIYTFTFATKFLVMEPSLVISIHLSLKS